jgi:hypothetical protein
MNSMPWRPSSAGLTCFAAAAAALFAGCGSDAQAPDGGGPTDADFAVCEGTPAVKYMPGMLVTSTAGAYVGTLVSAQTDRTPPVAVPEVGLGTWVVSVTDAAAGTPADVTMTAERPWMPLHGHGATTFPTVTPGDPGQFTVAAMSFFMAGYWEVKLDLQPTSGAADKLTFAICIPQ